MSKLLTYVSYFSTGRIFKKILLNANSFFFFSFISFQPYLVVFLNLLGMVQL